MSRQQKRRDPIKVMVVWTIVLALLAVGTWGAGTLLTRYRRARMSAMIQKVEDTNKRLEQEYKLAEAEFEQELAERNGKKKQWPVQNPEGWDVIDLSDIPLETANTVSVTRADAMQGGLLLVNEWHSRPNDFNDAIMTSIFTYAGDRRNNFGVQNSDQKLHPAAIEALIGALSEAKLLGFEHYVVNYAYRSYEEQDNLFQKKMQDIVDAYGTRYEGDALIARAKRDVNYPGTSEFNTGLSVTLYLYERGNQEINDQPFSTSQQGVWLYENCWRYGMIFRFPQEDFPIVGASDKSYKTGMSQPMNCYRYVGKGHAAVIYHMDMCLEEYIEYLQDHPHIAVFEDGTLKYEIVRQYVGDAESFTVGITQQALNYSVSLDNMGGAITVLEY